MPYSFLGSVGESIQASISDNLQTTTDLLSRIQAGNVDLKRGDLGLVQSLRVERPIPIFAAVCFERKHGSFSI